MRFDVRAPVVDDAAERERASCNPLSGVVDGERRRTVGELRRGGGRAEGWGGREEAGQGAGSGGSGRGHGVPRWAGSDVEDPSDDVVFFFKQKTAYEI